LDDDVLVDWNAGDIIIDTYRITDVLGEGGFGKVYKVFHEGWSVNLAVKTLRPELAESDDDLTDFIRECKLWVNLGLHPNIVSCYYVRILGGLPRIFIEFMNGGSLRDILSKGTLRLDKTIDICIQVLDGLAYAHDRGLVHLDIKPENIMMEIEGPAKVTDFGLASAISSVHPSDDEREKDSVADFLTIRKGIGGTPVYMPPEQWDVALGEIGQYTDIYSIGVMLYEMVCGQIPFYKAGMTIEDLKEAHINTPVQDPRNIVSDMPDRLAEVILRCLEKRPKDRFSNCADLRAVLVQVYQEIVGSEYHRPRIDETSLRASSLNNQAVSFYDLEEEERALDTFRQSIEIDPINPEATYNQGLLLWRKGEITDADFINRLETIRSSNTNDWVPFYLLALVHIERGDVESAIPLLEKTSELGGGSSGFEEILRFAQNEVEIRSIITPETQL
jgi:serine/threonine protein kinase